ncbi:hypothetical protein [Terriglobus sp. RCC_193]|uniref:hypothetical protein n=1 Tax=Terriglobus sp. RCC_193 TaxID=3239218 RepID=UPI0035257659
MNRSHTHHAGRSSRVSPAKGARRFAAGSQQKLFGRHAEVMPGCMSDGAMVRAVITEAIRNCTLSREEIAEEMSRLSGTTVTANQLYKYSADSRGDYRFPAELDRAFCFVTGDDRLLTCRAEAHGLHVIDDAGWQLLELGREYLRQKRAGQNIASLERELQEVEIG